MKNLFKKDIMILGFITTLFIMLLVVQSAKYEAITHCQEYTGNTYIACETIYEVR